MGTKGGRDRKSLRLRGHDYTSEGAYFVTLVSHKRECIFGDVVGDQVVLSKYGEIAREEWFASESIRKEIKLFEDELVIMPNHVHGIVWILPVDDVRATGRSPLQPNWKTRAGLLPKTLGAYVAGYKLAVAQRINRLRGTAGKPVRKRNYHDRIIRNEREFKAIRDYIIKNPLNWELDQYY